MAKLTQPVSRGVSHNKIFGWVAYLCFAKKDVVDQHSYHSTREEALEGLAVLEADFAKKLEVQTRMS